MAQRELCQLLGMRIEEDIRANQESIDLLTRQLHEQPFERVNAVRIDDMELNPHRVGRRLQFPNKGFADARAAGIEENRNSPCGRKQLPYDFEFLRCHLYV